MARIEDFLLLTGVQAVLFALVLLALVFAFRSILRTRATSLIVSGMLMLIAFWFSAMIPLPGWQAQIRPDVTSAAATEQANVSSGQPISVGDSNIALSTPTDFQPTNDTPVLVESTSLAEQIGGFVQQLEQIAASADDASAPIKWKSWFVMLAMLAVGLSAIRLMVAFISIQNLTRSSDDVSDHRVFETLDVVCAKLNCHRRIEIRQTDETNAALTIGWCNPQILISRDCGEWSQQQLEATLAHEVAHVVNGDFLQRIIAQSAAVLHFYNPFVHLLCHQLRLEQELAADQRAAEVLGGCKSYLNTLAGMALESDYPKGRLAPMFLPTRKTFFRRIEMLRSKKNLQSSNSRLSGWLCIVLVLTIGIGVAGLRLPNNSLAADDSVAAVTAAKGPSNSKWPELWADHSNDAFQCTFPERILPTS